MSKNIFVFVEQRGGSIQKVSLELIGEATRSEEHTSELQSRI